MATKRENLIASAEKSLQKGKVDAALKDYLKVLEETPGDINILNKIGDLFVRLNRNEESLPYFSRIAEHYSKEGFFLKAIAIYKKINKLDPSRLDVYERLAELYTKQGLAMEAKSQYQVLADYFQKQENFLGVIGIYQKMLQTEPSNIQLHVRLADLFTLVKRVPDALKEYMVVAQMLRDRGAQPEAVQVYGKALKLAPDSVEILKVLVPLLAESGQAEEARNLLKRALETTPRSVPLFVLAAETAMAANDMAEARSYGAKAQSVEAENEEVVQLVVKIHLKSRRPDLAFQAALPIVDLFVRRGEARKAINLLVPLSKSSSENEDLLKKLVDVHTAAGDEKGGVPFRAALAELWKKQGKLQEAIEALRICIRFSPEIADYRALHSQLESQLPAPVTPPRGPEPVEKPWGQPKSPPPPVVRPVVPAVAPPVVPKPIQRAVDEFEFDLTDEEEAPSQPAHPGAPLLPQVPQGLQLGPRPPAWGRPQSVEPPSSPAGTFGTQGRGYPQTGMAGITFGPSAPIQRGVPVPASPYPADDLEIALPDAYEAAELSPAEEVEDAVEVVEDAGPGFEFSAPGPVVEVDQKFREAVEELEEVEEVEELDVTAEIQTPPALTASTAFLAPPVQTPVPTGSFTPQSASSFTSQFSTQAAFAVPAIVPPPAFVPPPPVFSKPPAETVVEEALVEAEIFRKYGLLDKATDQLKGLLPQFPDHTRLREKLFELHLEQGNDAAAKEEAEILKKIYLKEGREDRIRGLAALLGEPAAPAVVAQPIQEAPPPLAAPEPAFETEFEAVPRTEYVPTAEAAPEFEATPEFEAAPASARELPPELKITQEFRVIPIVPEPVWAPTEPIVAQAAPIPQPVPVPEEDWKLPETPVPALPWPPSVTSAEPPVESLEPLSRPLPPAEVRPSQFSGSFPALKSRLTTEDLTAALTGQGPKPAPTKKRVEIDPLAQFGLTRSAPTVPKPKEKTPTGTATRSEVSALDALAAMTKPAKKAVPAPRPSDTAQVAALSPAATPRPVPILPPPVPLSADTWPEGLPAVQPRGAVSVPEPLLAPEPPPVLAPVNPSPEELSEVDFCLDQGMVVDAAERLQTLEGRYPGHADLAYRRTRLEGSRGSAEDAKKALSEIFSEDLEMVLDAELGRALTDEMARGPVGPPSSPSIPAPVPIDDSGLFSDEQEFFNFAEELQTEMKQDAIVQKAAGPQQEVSLEEIFREFKKGVEQQLSPEDFETHYNLGIAYKEMGLTDEAIGEFQIASKDPQHAVECCSMLGLCFLEKGLPQLAVKWYRKGLETQGIRDGDRLGLQYDLANVYANLGDRESAYRTFLDIYGADASFRDVSERVKEFEGLAS